MSHNNRKLGTRQVAILTALFEHLPTALTVGILAGLTELVDKQVKRVMASLAKNGLVVATPEPHTYRLTQTGKAVVAEALDAPHDGFAPETTPEVEEEAAAPPKTPAPPKPGPARKRRDSDPATASIMGDSTMRLPVDALPRPLPRVTVTYLAASNTIAVAPAAEGGRKAIAPNDRVGAQVHISRVLKEAGLSIADAKGRYQTTKTSDGATIVHLDRKAS